ncbi:unnamed protein product [Paramecium sonneborni]|uniref:Transmembrane protein n=1 Tax=Paramecium sonneborni TaxID=65129 RepID=A0A8S1RNN4_9CILI|nr:unnamed protein product [Paramecium sonneborni]
MTQLSIFSKSIGQYTELYICISHSYKISQSGFYKYLSIYLKNLLSGDIRKQQEKLQFGEHQKNYQKRVIYRFLTRILNETKVDQNGSLRTQNKVSQQNSFLSQSFLGKYSVHNSAGFKKKNKASQGNKLNIKPANNQMESTILNVISKVRIKLGKTHPLFRIVIIFLLFFFVDTSVLAFIAFQTISTANRSKDCSTIYQRIQQKKYLVKTKGVIQVVQGKQLKESKLKSSQNLKLYSIHLKNKERNNHFIPLLLIISHFIFNHFSPFFQYKQQKNQQQFNIFKKKVMDYINYEKEELFEIFVQVENVDESVFSEMIKIFRKENISDSLKYLSIDENQKHLEQCILKIKNLEFYEQEQLNFVKNSIKRIINILQLIKVHDFNNINYSSKKYFENKQNIIKKIAEIKKIIQFLKFLVFLTAIDTQFIDWDQIHFTYQLK